MILIYFFKPIAACIVSLLCTVATVQLLVQSKAPHLVSLTIKIPLKNSLKWNKNAFISIYRLFPHRGTRPNSPPPPRPPHLGLAYLSKGCGSGSRPPLLSCSEREPCRRWTSCSSLGPSLCQSRPETAWTGLRPHTQEEADGADGADGSIMQRRRTGDAHDITTHQPRNHFL